jgi:hypothetical protein
MPKIPRAFMWNRRASRVSKTKVRIFIPIFFRYSIRLLVVIWLSLVYIHKNLYTLECRDVETPYYFSFQRHEWREHLSLYEKQIFLASRWKFFLSNDHRTIFRIHVRIELIFNDLKRREALLVGYIHFNEKWLKVIEREKNKLFV